jgi:hypothetical protein
VTKKLFMLAACASAIAFGSGIAYADDPPKDGPDPNGPKCDYFDGGDTHDKWQRTPCGWIYGDDMGWQRRP